MEVVELLLCFVQWAAQDEFWNCASNSGERDAELALKQMMRGLKILALRTQGQAWNITKVHELKHMAMDITRFGSPQNTNTGPTEHHHIEHAKIPAQTVRHDRFQFDMSVAQRYIDFIIMDIASSHCASPFLTGQKSSESKMPCDVETEQSTIGSTHVTLKFIPQVDSQGNVVVVCDQQWKTRSKSVSLFPQQLLSFLARHLKVVDVDQCTASPVDFEVFTELWRKGVCFRAHPNYQGQGPWHDWVYVRWENHGFIPAQIQLFFWMRLPTGEYTAHCVVHSSSSRGERNSVLT